MPRTFFAFENGAWTFKYTSGDEKGETQEQRFEKMKRDEAGATGRYSIGKNNVYYLVRGDNGDISITSEQDNDQGVISRFAPPEPIYVGNLKPGEKPQVQDRREGVRSELARRGVARRLISIWS